MQDGIWYIDKPVGPTSFDVIRRLRGKYGVRRIGHAGTLDPAASGLLIIGVGRTGTKQLTDYIKLDKTYAVTIELGVATDTADREGEVIEQRAVDEPPSREEVEDVLADLIGVQELPVPRYSAVKVDGVPLYKRVRRGENVEPPVRQMRIDRLALEDIYFQNGTWYIDVVMDVASGVYVRSVVEEIGRRLGYPVTTATLRRTRVGGITIDDAVLVD